MEATAAVPQDEKPDPSEGAKTPASPAPPPPASVVTIPPATTEAKTPAPETAKPSPARAPSKVKARWFQVWRPSWWLTTPDGE